MTTLAKCNTVGDIESQFWMSSEVFDVMGIKPTAMLTTSLAGKIIPLKDSGSPFSIGQRHSDLYSFWRFFSDAFIPGSAPTRVLITAHSLACEMSPPRIGSDALSSIPCVIVFAVFRQSLHALRVDFMSSLEFCARRCAFALLRFADLFSDRSIPLYVRAVARAIFRRSSFRFESCVTGWAGHFNHRLNNNTKWDIIATVI